MRKTTYPICGNLRIHYVVFSAVKTAPVFKTGDLRRNPETLQALLRPAVIWIKP